MVIYPYKAGSKSVKALKQALGIKSIKLLNSKFKPRAGKTIINWGSSSLPEEYWECNILNHPSFVENASNKLNTLLILINSGISYPDFSTEKEDAEHLIGIGKKVVCRTVLNGHSGQGIVIASKVEELVDAPLYVEYIPKKEEYRVHVFQGEAFFVQRKARRMEEENPNWQIRNHQNGFIYANQDVDVPEHVKEMACKAVDALDLDFGAVDIIWNERHDKYYVLEVNTAPGLSGTTLNKYAEKFKEYV